jgi:hypothetical protein
MLNAGNRNGRRWMEERGGGGMERARVNVGCRSIEEEEDEEEEKEEEDEGEEEKEEKSGESRKSKGRRG